MAATVVVAAAAALALAAKPPPQAVQYQQSRPGGSACLATADNPPREAGAVTLAPCDGSATVWQEGADALGNPQVALYASGLRLCLNDFSVRCDTGNNIILHECQQPGKGAHVNVANHWVFEAGTLRATFCNASGHAPMCAAVPDGSATAVLVPCSSADAKGWVRAAVPSPPSPPPVPPLPPPDPIPPGRPCHDCPNIVFVLTDDQDIVLGGALPSNSPGGATPLHRAKALLMDQGAHAMNFHIHTPICCPSRSETLTGRYLHNVKLPVAEKQCGGGYGGNDAFGNVCCMHVDEGLVNNNTFAKHLAIQAGYRVGMFGKYLNNCPAQMQPGFSAWFANGGGTYYAPEFAVDNVDGLPDGSHTFNKTDYSTSLIGNYSLAWIKKVATDGTNLPWMAYIGTKACHDPFQPAPWYANTWSPDWPAHAPRPPSYNVSQSVLSKHHPTVSTRPSFGDKTEGCIDGYFKDRWRTLMSVDDIIDAADALVGELGLTNRTYFVYTSDHGYSLGELNLNWDKRNVYDFDVRIHLVVRGPGIAPGSSFDQLASNVDLAPTFMSMAGLPRPDTMDGRSLLPLLLSDEAQAAASPDAGAAGSAVPGSVRRWLRTQPSAASIRAGWRTSHFIEYYYVGIGGDCGMAPIELPDNNFIAIRVMNTSASWLYAEFQNGTDGNVAFDAPLHYELFDMGTDPWQLRNVHDEASGAVAAALHAEVQRWLHCKGDSCP